MTRWSVPLCLLILGCGGKQAPPPVDDLPSSPGALVAPPEAPADAALPPPVDAAPPDPAGPRSPDTLRRVIYGNHQNIVNCAHTNAHRDVPVVGKILVAFRLEADGAVTDVDLADAAVDEPDFMVCLRRELRKLRFPPAERRMTVRYPFNFKGR